MAHPLQILGQQQKAMDGLGPLDLIARIKSNHSDEIELESPSTQSWRSLIQRTVLNVQDAREEVSQFEEKKDALELKK
jgi:hypothetical protein